VVNAARLPVPLALGAMSVAAAVGVALPEGWPIRAILVTVFLLVAPGLLLLPLLPADGGRWVFVVPISIAVDVLVSEVAVILRGDLTATVLTMTAIVFAIAVARSVWLVSRPVDGHATSG
jgi:hypothetical protein